MPPDPLLRPRRQPAGGLRAAGELGQTKASYGIMMGNADAKSKCALGFLTVVDHPQHGLCGGYLVLNRSGRPLEFHCTTPLRPNRAQEILYGPTLRPFLYGEQIGQALLSKSKIAPAVVCTDQEPALAVADYCEVPVVLVLGSTPAAGADARLAEPGNDKTVRLDAAHRGGPALHCFHVGPNELALPGGSDQTCRHVAERLAELGQTFDLFEPFSRIREAIEEAQRAAR
jgi:hypothetical protein